MSRNGMMSFMSRILLTSLVSSFFIISKKQSITHSEHASLMTITCIHKLAVLLKLKRTFCVQSLIFENILPVVAKISMTWWCHHYLKIYGLILVTILAPPCHLISITWSLSLPIRCGEASESGFPTVRESDKFLIIVVYCQIIETPALQQSQQLNNN